MEDIFGHVLDRLVIHRDSMTQKAHTFTTITPNLDTEGIFVGGRVTGRQSAGEGCINPGQVSASTGPQWSPQNVFPQTGPGSLGPTHPWSPPHQ